MDTLNLQYCSQCQRANYPERELCGYCLNDSLEWRNLDNRGKVYVSTCLHYSLEEEYLQHLPWRLVSVKLSCGPVVIAHAATALEQGVAVRVRQVKDSSGRRLLLASNKETEQQSRDWLQQVNFSEVDQ